MKGSSSKKSKGSSTKKKRQQVEEQVVEVVTHNVDNTAGSREELLNKFLNGASKIRKGHDEH